MRIGVDTGGTFTDSVRWEGDRLRLGKVSSTPQDPAAAVITALQDAASAPQLELFHGTTVATNALLERKGARTALVTNAGFEDLLELGRQTRPDLYSLHPRRPASLVPAHLRFGINGRRGPRGEAWGELDSLELELLPKRLRAAGVEAVAICLLHAWRDPAQEQTVARALEGLGVPISLSSSVLPRFREYERTSTTVVNAYLQPKLQQYLGRLSRLPARQVAVMLSSGGVLPAAEAAGVPARLLLSGPAAGVLGARWLGRRHAVQGLLTFDMGGTSSDVALADAEAGLDSEAELGGLAIALPRVEIHTVGAGGGSIARLDGGRLRVGPESAGADPGPACYGRGSLPTVTDANVVLGRLPEDLQLGGHVRLDAERARHAIGGLASAMGLTVEETAEGIVRVVNANMEQALRVVSVRRGIDPRPLTLCAFGGAGPLHAVALAEGLGMDKVLIPALAGTLSALGLLVAEQVRHQTQSLMLPLGMPALDQARAWFATQEALFPEARPLREIEVRYQGQSFELTVPFAEDPEAILQAFHQAHLRRFGTRHEVPLELVHLSLRLTQSDSRAEIPAAILEPDRRTPRQARVYLDGHFRTVPRVDQWSLRENEVLPGPAVLSSAHATCYVPPGWTARATADRDLWLERTSP